MNNVDWIFFELSFNYWITLHIDWILKFNVDAFLTISPFGWCKTFNIINNERMFHENSVAEYVKYKIVENVYPTSKFTLNLTDEPLYTTKKETGFHGFMTDHGIRYLNCNTLSPCISDTLFTTIIIHSPFEMPDQRHRHFVMQLG